MTIKGYLQNFLYSSRDTANQLLTTLTNDPADEQALKEASSLIHRVSKQWFVSAEVRSTVEKIKTYVDAHKISRLQDLPVKFLVDNAPVREFILANHLHHKITPQHRATGCGIQIIDEKAHFPVAEEVQQDGIIASHRKRTKLVPFEELSDKTKHFEFLANGLEIHAAKEWHTLRPLYAMQEKDGKYVHIDTLTGQEETLGDVGKDYVQLLNVKPWGWNPRGGSLFGHTWIRFVIDGQLYHMGANLQGRLLNPDFMATVPRHGKKIQAFQKISLDPNKDAHGFTQSERLFLRLENLQASLLKRPLPHPEAAKHYADRTFSLYELAQFQCGGTCTTSALTFLGEVTGQKVEQVGRNFFSRGFFRFLDCIWSVFPRFIRTHVIRPLQALTRGGKPRDLENI